MEVNISNCRYQKDRLLVPSPVPFGYFLRRHRTGTVVELDVENVVSCQLSSERR